MSGMPLYGVILSRVIAPTATILCYPLAISVKFIFIICHFILSYFPPFTTPEIHSRRVKIVQDQVLEWNQNGRKTKMCTGRASWKTISWRPAIYKSTMTRISVDMGDIIEVDIQNQVVRVEPLLEVGDLSKHLLKMGWVVPLIPELKNLTVGGLVCGTGIETSGHKYGFFQHVCVAFEVVVPDGRVINCSKDENPDLFYSIPWSHGTLGFLTSATLMIIRATKYIEVEYMPVHSLDEAVQVFESQTLRESGNDYVEGIMFGSDKGVIMVGNMASTAGDGTVNTISRWYKPLFFRHVESFLKKFAESRHIEYIPIRDYIHRHNRGAFWEMQYMFPYQNNVIYRYLFGWVIPMPYWFMNLFLPHCIKESMDNFHILQDYVVPLGKLKEFFLFANRQTKVSRIWLCPTKIFNNPGMCKPKTGQIEMYVDIGVYGMTHMKGFDVEKTGKKLEDLCLEMNGFQFLYADVFLTKDKFEKMLDHELYYKVRNELNCEDAFPEVYDKIRRSARR